MKLLHRTSLPSQLAETLAGSRYAKLSIDDPEAANGLEMASATMIEWLIQKKRLPVTVHAHGNNPTEVDAASELGFLCRIDEGP